MSQVRRLLLAIAAFALVVFSVAMFGGSPAGAATGSLAAVSNGVTVTYSGSTSNDNVSLLVWRSGHTCDINDPVMGATYYMSSDASSPPAMQLAASPATLTFGSAAFTMNGFTATTIAAGSFTFCLRTFVSGPGGGQAIAAQQDATIIDPTATTTTTSTSTTTTTAPSPTTTVVSTSTTAGSGGSTGGDPLVPTFTG